MQEFVARKGGKIGEYLVSHAEDHEGTRRDFIYYATAGTGAVTAGATMTNVWSAPLAFGLAAVALSCGAITTGRPGAHVLRSLLPFAATYVLLVSWTLASGTPDRRGIRPNLFGPTEGADWLVASASAGTTSFFGIAATASAFWPSSSTM